MGRRVASTPRKAPVNPVEPTYLAPGHRKLWRGALAVLDKCRMEGDSEKVWAAEVSEIAERKTSAVPVKD